MEIWIQKLTGKQFEIDRHKRTALLTYKGETKDVSYLFWTDQLEQDELIKRGFRFRRT